MPLSLPLLRQSKFQSSLSKTFIVGYSSYIVVLGPGCYLNKTDPATGGYRFYDYTYLLIFSTTISFFVKLVNIF